MTTKTAHEGFSYTLQAYPDPETSCIRVRPDDQVPGHILVSINDPEGYAGLYLTPAVARQVAGDLTRWANQEEPLG